MIVSMWTMTDHHFNYSVRYCEGPGEQPGMTIIFEQPLYHDLIIIGGVRDDV